MKARARPSALPVDDEAAVLALALEVDLEPLRRVRRAALRQLVGGGASKRPSAAWPGRALDARTSGRARTVRSSMRRSAIHTRAAAARTGRERELDRADLARARRRPPVPTRTRSRGSECASASSRRAARRPPRWYHQTFRPLGSASLSSSRFRGPCPRSVEAERPGLGQRDARPPCARPRSRRRPRSRSRAASRRRAGPASGAIVEPRQPGRHGNQPETSWKSSRTRSGMVRRRRSDARRRRAPIAARADKRRRRPTLAPSSRVSQAPTRLRLWTSEATPMSDPNGTTNDARSRARPGGASSARSRLRDLRGARQGGAALRDAARRCCSRSTA